MQPFEALSTRLLEGGVAYPHVQRFIAELKDHFDDVVRAETARGASSEAATATAWARLGDPEHLIASMLARPELRALTARFPRLIFGAVPLVAWIASLLATGFLIAFCITAARSFGWLPNTGAGLLAHLQTPVNVLVFIETRVVPIVLGALMIGLAVRQRAAMTWPLIGAALMAFIAGSTTADVTFAVTPGTPNSFSIASSFFGPFGQNADLLLQSLARAGAMFLLILTPLWAQRLFKPRQA